jgi:hypothetical protein
LAEVSRPNTKEPPIMILSDGTVFWGNDFTHIVFLSLPH